MIIRELVARGEIARVLIICPAGLTRNWQQELNDCFRLDFEIVGRDFIADRVTAWERHVQVIASIDKLKRPPHLDRLLAGPKWDLVVFDEAHHLTRRNKGKTVTQNYRFAEALRGHTRSLLFLSATPHQGDQYQFWSLIRLLDDELFESAEAMLDNRGLLNRVMFRRIKREVTDALGRPIFMRRLVHSQKFSLGVAERSFYDKLTEYLREGYGIAGVGQSRTTTEQRAIGFVMATFQKIMSSSPRAIKQALRRRLLVLLARKQLTVDAARAKGHTSPDTAQHWFALQDEMLRLASEILGLSPTARGDAEKCVLQVKQRLARRLDEEITEWALDAEEEFESALYADAEIPDEANKVRKLIGLVPDSTDRKFDTLVRAIEEIRRELPEEKFLIFTQYRETQEYLFDALKGLYGDGKIALLHGGPLDDKIAAVERFWSPDGAQFLISTSAGGEGINLQVCRVMFNYDLPWNPMAVEQRIGRLHRYGQQDTVQVYNLVAEDTVEERIYFLLEEKLLEIAQTIGKIDEHGDVVEDFRSEVLGFLGTSPNYQELYKRALVDRDYRRTAAEIAEAMEHARQASEALRALTQDLDRFDLEHYHELRGQFNLEDLKRFAEKAILRLGGAFVPVGDEVYRVETPACLLGRSASLLARYDQVTFDRGIAMRRKKIEFLGLGHPLIDALIAYLKSPSWQGVVALLPGDGKSESLSARWLITAHSDSDKPRQYYHRVNVDSLGSVHPEDERHDLHLLSVPDGSSGNGELDLAKLRACAEADLAVRIAELRAAADGRSIVRPQLAGIAVTT
jgi:superfamily II DNA or RNA helicase